jgi:hypothetical protein
LTGHYLVPGSCLHVQLALFGFSAHPQHAPAVALPASAPAGAREAAPAPAADYQLQVVHALLQQVRPVLMAHLQT